MERPRVLVLGSNGMVGHVVADALEKSGEFEVLRLNRRPQGNEVFYDGRQPLMSLWPKYVVNCIGLLPKDCDANPDLAIWTNGHLPFSIASQIVQIKAKLIHISTDCVFEGTRGKYATKDKPDATSVYGQSKILGEVDSPKHLTIRTSVIGPELRAGGIGLFNWFMHQKEKVNGYTNVFWNGVTTLTLANFILKQIKDDVRMEIGEDGPGMSSGIVQLASDTVSKSMILAFISGIWKKNVPIIDRAEEHSDKTLVPDFAAPNIFTQLGDLYNYMVKNKERYIPIYGKEWL